MSRRKQANPRSLKVHENIELGHEVNGNCYKLVSKYNGIHDDQESDQDPDDYDEFAPLVVDIPGQDDTGSHDNQPTTPTCEDPPPNPLRDSDNPATGEDEVKFSDFKNLLPSVDTSEVLSSAFQPIQPNSTRLGISVPSTAVLSQDLSNSSSEQDPVFRDVQSSVQGSSSGQSRTASLSSDHQLSPGGLSSSISASKVHRRGKKNQSEEGDDTKQSSDDDDKILPIASEGGNNRYVCPICQEVLGSSHDLTVHIRTHNSQQPTAQANTCTICGKVLSSQSSLDRHMLVHSGERPFQCKICKMSFTTNGNMHRHARIHSKENDLNVKVNRAKPKTPVTMSFYPGTPSTTNVTSMELPMTSPLLNRDFPPRILGYGDPTSPKDLVASSMKRPYSFLGYSSDWNTESPAKRPYLPSPNIGSSKSSAFSMPALKKEEKEKDVPGPADLSSISHTVTTPSLPVKAVESNVPKDKPLMIEIDEKDQDQLHCPVCNKAFLCKYGLETHLETHPNFSMKCSQCDMSFPTPRGLNMHRLMMHSKEKVTEEEEQRKLDVKSDTTTAVIGFYDLSFVDFSVSKFPLVAKSWCEENVRKSSSMYHDFNCDECGKAFPCKTALVLHQNTHSPEKTAQCPLCECDFTDARQLHLHMLKHLSDKAFNDVKMKEKAKHDKTLLKSPKSDKIGQHDFLAAFGLTTVSEAEILEKEKREKKKENIEKTENNDYFAKLGQVYSPDVSMMYPFFNRKDINMSPEEQMKAFIEMQKVFQTAAGEMMKNLSSPNGLSAGMESMNNMSQLKAFMPAMMPFNMPGSNLGNLTALTAMMQSNPMLLSTMLTNQNTASPLPTPPPSSDSGSGSSGEMGDKYGSKNGMFPCMYCDMVFNNYRTLKGHVRTHLGLSPYKCNLCSYSSADKSTLIRHLRTHNGERPFQCRVCDFAFTTKANCERHVRKKHGKILKDEVEAAIGYNKYVMESTSTTENFHSPDTVCKYCGEDFKFFRALKHHLRSHSSCRQKPFQCLKCDIGFSTKANCMRHLQKQHQDVAQHQIEQYIQVNGPISEDGDKSMYEGMSDDGMTQDSRNTGTPSSVTSMSSLPPAAHSTPRLTTPTGSRPETPRQRLEHVTIKQEPMDQDDGPLDFSVKSRTPTPSGVKQQVSVNDDDTPMDLSVKKKEMPFDDIGCKPESAKHTYEGGKFQCQFCPLSFSGYHQLEMHLVQSHKQIAELMASQMQGLAVVDPLTGNLKLPIKPPPTSVDRLKVSSKFLSKKTTSILPKEKIKTEPPSYDPSSDLASVKRILDATKAQSFHSFLLDQSSPISKDKPIRDIETSVSANEKDFNNSMMEDGEDSSPYSPQSKGSNSNLDEDMEKDMLEVTSAEHFAQMFRDASPGGFSMPRAPLPKTLTDVMDKTQLKKKRNSYADSPHKLQCPYCTRTFPWVSSLTRHLLTHTGQKPFKCPRCPVTFSTKSNRERHLIRKHGLNMLDPLSRQTMDRPYKCHLCVFSSFSTQGNLLKHYKERHSGCKLPDTLADLDKAVTEGLSHTIPPHERGRFDPNSAAAQESYNRDNQLNEADKLDQSYEQSVDVEKVSSPYEGSEDMRSDEEEDDIIPLSIDTSTIEEPILPPPPTTTSTPLPKTNPVKSFTGSAERQINPERDNYNVDKITSCWKCGERFVSRKILVRHLKEHNIDLPYKCYLCDASYELRKDCLLHQEKSHSSDWKILREKNKVDDIDKFSKHMDKVVENNCNKVDQGSVLEIPAQSVDDMKMEVVSADYMQRKVYCSLCPKRFWSLQDLRRHMRSHTGERPFECDICQKRFTLKHSMMRHRKKHTDAGSLSPSDDEDSIQGTEENLAGKSNVNPHHRPILPRMPSSVSSMSSIPLLPMSVMTINRESPKEKPLLEAPPPPKRENSPSVAVPPTFLSKAQYSSMTVESDSKDNSADILHNLLGVDVGSIDRMLDSADNAAQMLGV